MSRRRYVPRDRVAELEDLYAELPPLECRGKCQESCGPIDMSDTERRRIREAGVDIPPLLDRARRGELTRSCPALSPIGTCSVYELRPLVCRLWGLVEAMACPYGCRPEGGWLDDTTGMELIARSLDIGGRTSTMDGPTAAAVRQLMANPRIASMVGAVMRGGDR